MGFKKHTSMHMIGVFLLLPVLIDIATGQMRILKNISDIRLVNGIGLYDGRVELLVNGTWGTICSTSFHRDEARAICNILFGTRWYMTFDTTSYDYGAGSGPIYIDNLDCKGTETNINECTYSLDVSCTDHNRDVAVACRVLPLNITNTRLVNGTGPYDGRIELYVDGHWGTINRRGVDMYDAQTICNTHGASLAMYFDTAIYGEGTGPVLIDYIVCSKEMDTINSCDLYAPYRPSSSHLYDLSIACTPCGLPDIYNGDPVAFNGTELTVSCHTGFHPSQGKMKCLTDNSWSENQRCTPNHVFPLNISDIQLANSNRPSEGRVEIKVNGTWGTICDTDFDVDEASVICKMIGLQYSRHYTKVAYGRGSGPIYVDNLDCNGTEGHINLCSYEISNNCTHYDDVAVVCTGITGVRLTDGPSPTNGRVEVKILDTWGTVCDDFFGMKEANVICSMLGYPPAVKFYPSAYYGRGTGPIFVDDLTCEGDATHINNCTYRTDDNCNHGEDVSVVCTDCRQPDIYYWGADFLTYSGTTMYADCSYNRTNIGKLKLTCDKETKSWITEGECQEYSFPLDITGVRLTDGPSTTNGRVEFKSLDTWGTVCDDSFGMKEANAICSMLGYPPAAKFYPGAYYGPGTGPIFVDDLSCEADATHINNCTYHTYDNCNHDDDVSVVCTDCGDPTPENGFVNSTQSHYGATVHVACDKDYNLIGDNNIICQINGTWSNNPNCKLIDCGDPKPANGNINTTSTVHTTVATVWCNDGYTLIGDSVITCQSNETWTNYPACEIRDCRIPKPTFADVTLLDDKTTFGETAVISCWTGYIPIINTSVSCLADGAWEEWPECEVVDCGNPVPQKGSANSSETTYKTVLEITCDVGYILVGLSTITCQANGTWTDYSVCDKADCGDPKLANGNINTTSKVHTTVATVWCNDGYTLIGDIVITCLSNDTWTNYPACKIIDCRIPEPKFSDVALLDNKTTFGETAIISCWTGYIPVINTTVSCLGNGTWEKWPECEIVDCGNPVPQKGSANSSEMTYRTVLEITCEVGYILVGLSTITCQANGAWTDYPVCDKADCGNPVPQKGSANSSETTYKTVLEITCDVGYILVGLSTITCQANGTWTDYPVCDKADCGDPKLANGNINTTSKVHTTVATVWCNDGYTLIGDIVITCLSNDTWTNYPACKIIDCRFPEPKFSDVALLDNKTTFGETAIISCWTGYIPVINTTVSCLGNGTWEKWPECEIVDCGNPVPQKGSANSSEMTYKTVLEITCDVGYILVGLSTITCQANGTWTDYPVCDKADCGNPVPQKGSTNSSEMTYKTVLEITCDVGYILVGLSTITCQANGTWTDYPVCDKADCGNPVPQKGSANSSETTYKTVLEITCDVGYILVGLSTITCQANGTWTDYPVCDKADCGDPKLANGNINTTSKVHTTVATVWCNDGYTLIGDIVITCLSNDTWTNYPACKIIDCRFPEPKFSDVALLDNKTTFGETAIISCWTGYIPVINTTVSCLGNGTWEKWPECEIVDCGNPVPQKGSANSSEMTYKTVLEITCDVGYILVGLSTITCQANGTWTDYPVCDKADCGNPVPQKGSTNSSEMTYKTVLEITCDVGYILVGLSTITCQANGTWTDYPVCDKAAKSVDSGNMADSFNIGVVIGVGVGSVAVTLLVVGIVIIIRRHLRHGELRRHTPENTHELTDVQQGNVRTMQESPNTPPTAGSSYVNTPPSVYEDLKDSNKDADIYDRIGGANVS